MPARHIRRLPLLAILAAVATPAVRADAQNVVFETGTPFVSSAQTASFGTTGALMNGMVVTAYFGDVVRTATWGALDAFNSGVSTDLFFLFHQSNLATGSSLSWNLGNLSTDRFLTRLVFNGAPGRTVFDVTLFTGDGVGTPGSSTGSALEISTFDLPSSVLARSVVTYRNVVSIVGSAPFGDLYEEVDLDMASGLAPGRPLAFRMDTDNLPSDATIVPGSGDAPAGSVVPEPGSLLLVGTGLVGAALASRRRRI